MPDHAALKTKIDELAERARDVKAIEARSTKLIAEGYGEGVGGQAGVAVVGVRSRRLQYRGGAGGALTKGGSV